MAVFGSVASLMTRMASFKGIVMKRETTSKLRIMSSGYIFSVLISFINSLKSLMKDYVLSTRGLRILATYFASS